MSRKLVVVIVAVVLAVGALTAGIAFASGAVGGDDDQSLSGTTLQRASAAALAHTGGGTVNATEVGDDGAAYGVEVRLPNGSQVEVSLDENFNVVDQAADDDGTKGEDDGAGDD
jgi:hypothetical protein